MYFVMLLLQFVSDYNIEVGLKKIEVRIRIMTRNPLHPD